MTFLKYLSIFRDRAFFNKIKVKQQNNMYTKVLECKCMTNNVICEIFVQHPQVLLKKSICNLHNCSASKWPT